MTIRRDGRSDFIGMSLYAGRESEIVVSAGQPVVVGNSSCRSICDLLRSESYLECSVRDGRSVVSGGRRGDCCSVWRHEIYGF